MLIERFRQIAKNNQDSVAVECEDKSITYGELDRQSDELAKKLQDMGIAEGSPIEIYMKKRIETIVAMLAVLKSGCIYIPVDINWPQQRIDRVGMISGAKAQLVYEGGIRINPLDYQASDTSHQHSGNAYIIFTSGSTGEPKGIPIKVNAIENHIDGLLEILDPKYTTVACVAPTCFDMSVAQIYYALLTGRKLVLVPDDIKIIPDKLCDYLAEHEVQVCDITPTHLNMVLQYIRVAKNKTFVPLEIVSGGEALPVPLAKDIIAEKSAAAERIINFYGPTETCVYATYYVVDKDNADSLTLMKVGKTMKNMHVLVLADNGELCKANETGEICIWGPGVSDGYIGNEEKKKAAFVNCQYAEGLMYKTGDYGYIDDLGEVVCHGRKDDQVKIRGYRIELREIEKTLEKVPTVTRAKVLVCGELNKKKIVGFYTGKEKIAENLLKEELSKALPHYMVPAQIIWVDNFESTINGKIDSAKLRELVKEVEVVEKDIDATIIDICAKVLRVDPERLSAESDFVEEGAESIDLMELFLEISERYGVDIDISYLLEHSLIGDYIKEVKRLLGEEKNTAVRADKTKVSWMILTCLKNEKVETQRKLIHNNEEFPAYNIVHAIDFNEHLDPLKIKESVAEVIRLHGAFQTVFTREKGKYYACRDNTAYTADDFFKYVTDVDGLTDKDLRAYVEHFEAGKLPLFRVILFEKDNAQRMILNIHHGIFDYFSMKVFLSQVFKKYKGIEFAETTTDFITGLNDDMEKDLTEYKAFWNKYLKNRGEVARIPGNDGGRISLDSHFSNYDYFVDKTDGRITGRVREYAVSEYNFMISLFAVLLSYYSGKEDVLMGSYIPGRSEDKGQTIGMFTKMVPVRFRIPKHAKLRDIVHKQQTEFSSILKNQVIDLPSIYESMDTEDFEKGELFDVIFNYVNDINISIGDLEVKTHEMGDEPEKVPFSIKLFSNDERIKITATVCDEHYSKDMVDEIIRNYLQLLESAIGEREKSNGRVLLENNPIFV